MLIKKLMLVIFSIAAIIHAVSGQQIDDFSLKDVRSEKAISLSAFSDKKGVVIIFTSNICPYSVYYEGRITQLIAEYNEAGIQFLLINSHAEDKESAVEMANKISTWGLQVPYLADKEQKVLIAFKANKSPEAFLLKNNNGKFSIFYKGAIDNNPQVATDVKEQYLKGNIERLLSNKEALSGGRAIGCMVKRN